MVSHVFRFVCAACVVLAATAAMSGPRELTVGELRLATASGKAMGLKRVIEAVVVETGGAPIDARAFQSGDIYYRVLIKKPNGRVVSMIVNARTGVATPADWGVGRDIDRVVAGPSSGAPSAKAQSGAPGTVRAARTGLASWTGQQ